MTIIELLQKVGAANVRMQRVDQSIVQAKSVHGNTHLTIETNQLSPVDVMNLTAGVPLPMHGLVLWIPSKLLEPDGKNTPTAPPDWADRLAELWIHNSAAFGGDMWKAELAKKVRAELERTLSGVVITHEQADRFIKTISEIRTALLRPDGTDMDQVSADLKAMEKELHAARKPPPK